MIARDPKTGELREYLVVPYDEGVVEVIRSGSIVLPIRRDAEGRIITAGPTRDSRTVDCGERWGEV
jgi:hypothetical protein